MYSRGKNIQINKMGKNMIELRGKGSLGKEMHKKIKMFKHELSTETVFFLFLIFPSGF